MIPNVTVSRLRVAYRTARVGVGLESQSGWLGSLFLGQAIHPVVEHQQRHVHVIAYGVDPVRGAYGKQSPSPVETQTSSSDAGS